MTFRTFIPGPCASPRVLDFDSILSFLAAVELRSYISGKCCIREGKVLFFFVSRLSVTEYVMGFF